MKAEEWKCVEERLRVKQREVGGREGGRGRGKESERARDREGEGEHDLTEF